MTYDVGNPALACSKCLSLEETIVGLHNDLLSVEAEAAAMRRALERATTKLTAYVGVCAGDKELTNTVLPMALAALAPEAGKLLSDLLTEAENILSEQQR